MQRSEQRTPVSRFLRRNGQQSSCENCRKSKIACDHAIPHCGRCVRLKRTDSCKYVLSPLAKSSTPGILKSAAVGKRQPQAQTRPLTKAISIADSLLSEDSLVTQVWARRSVGPETLPRDRPDNLSKTTSWGSIFSEFNIEVGPKSRLQSSPGESAILSWNDPELLKHAMTALTRIPAREMCTGLLERAVKYPDSGCHEAYLRLLHESWWEEFETYLEKNMLEPVIEQLWDNSAKRAVEYSSSDSVEWLSSWTGPSTTWDSLAFLLSQYGSACASLAPSHPLLADGNKGLICRNIGKGIKACLFICEALDVSSVNLINAHASMLLLQNSYDGDHCRELTAKHNYTNLVQLARVVINTDLNVGSTGTCFIQTQLVHKAFHRAYTIDKSICTSSGVPPQLTRRFSKCPLPLELSDEELLLSGDELNVVLSQLDQDGWSTKECSHPVSYLRALSLLGKHREEILELTMEPNTRTLADIQSEIADRLKATYTRLPQRLQYSPAHLKNLAPFDFLHVNFLYLEYHKDIFLLYRLSRSIPLSQNVPLLSSAKAIINVMTMLYSGRERLGGMFLFYPWAITFYGIPAAAILAIELLIRPRFLTLYPSSCELLPRSEIIQELSVFISCLKSIPKTEGNHAPCSQVAPTLQKILDEVLEPPLGTPSNTTVSSASTPGTTLKTDVDSPIGLDIDWQVFVTGPCDPVYTQWLDSNTWTDLPEPLDFSIENLGLDLPSDACFKDFVYRNT